MATIPCSFRPDPELFARLEQRAFQKGITKAELIQAAVRAYLDVPPPFPWRRQLGALLHELLICKAFGHSIARQLLGEDVVEDSLPELKRATQTELEGLLDRLDALDRE